MRACVNCTTNCSQLNAKNVIKFITSASHLINTNLHPFVGDNDNNNDDTRSNGHIRFLKTDHFQLVDPIQAQIIILRGN